MTKDEEHKLRQELIACRRLALLGVFGTLAFAALYAVHSVSHLVQGEVPVSLTNNLPFWGVLMMLVVVIMWLVITSLKCVEYQSEISGLERKLKDAATHKASILDQYPKATILNGEVKPGEHFIFRAEADYKVDVMVAALTGIGTHDFALWIDGVRCILSTTDYDPLHTGFMLIKAGSHLSLTHESLNDPFTFRVQLVKVPA